MCWVVLVLLAVAPGLWAAEPIQGCAPCQEARQTNYTCNDGIMEGSFYLTDVGEGFANRFTPAVYPSRIEAVTIAAFFPGDRDLQTCVAYVWADAGGQPGAVLWSGPAAFDVTATSWFQVPVTSDVIITSGSFWVGYLDDGSLTMRSPFDDPDACGTYYYYPATGEWMPLYSIGFAYGVYLGAVVGEGVPVELASFEAQAVTDGVRLAWRTLSETNCFGFHLLRSRDALDHGMVVEGSFVAGNGTCAVPHDYSFLDRTVTPGPWFYRLVQIDSDGATSTHGPVRVVYAPPGSTTWGRIKREFDH